MRQRTLVLVAAGLTTFLLVLVGSLVATVSRSATTLEPTVSVAPALGDAPPAGLDPAVEALIREREAAYQAALNEAQAQLDQANQQLDQITPAAAPPTNSTAEPISTDAAIAAATTYLGGGSVRKAELERERGILVYEVKFTDGSTVYVDATQGQVVYAEVAGQQGNNADHDDDDDDNDDD